MLILILIDVQYSQKAVFSFEKGSDGQNHTFSGSPCPVKKSQPPNKIFDPPTGGNTPHSLLLLGKPCLGRQKRQQYNPLKLVMPDHNGDNKHEKQI